MNASGSKPELDDIDSGWEDEDDVDAGWEDAEATMTVATPEQPSRLLTPEEREARAARVAAKKRRAKAKAAENAGRRKAREAAAAAKQKKSGPRPSTPPRERPKPERKARRQAAAPGTHPEIAPATNTDSQAPVAGLPRRNTRVLVIVGILAVAAVVAALLLARR